MIKKLHDKHICKNNEHWRLIWPGPIISDNYFKLEIFRKSRKTICIYIITGVKNTTANAKVKICVILYYACRLLFQPPPLYLNFSLHSVAYFRLG